MTGRSVPDSVGKWGVPDDVLVRAVEAGARAERAHGVKVCEDFDPHLPDWDDDNMSEPLRENYRREARRILGAAAPVIAEAAYRAGIEDARTKVIGLHAKGVSRILAALAALTDAGEDED